MEDRAQGSPCSSAPVCQSSNQPQLLGCRTPNPELHSCTSVSVLSTTAGRAASGGAVCGATSLLGGHAGKPPHGSALNCRVFWESPEGKPGWCSSSLIQEPGENICSMLMAEGLLYFYHQDSPIWDFPRFAAPLGVCATQQGVRDGESSLLEGCSPGEPVSDLPWATKASLHTNVLWTNHALGARPSIPKCSSALNFPTKRPAGGREGKKEGQKEAG